MLLLSASPWGDVDHFFRRLWTDGMEAPSEALRPKIELDYLKRLLDQF